MCDFQSPGLFHHLFSWAGGFFRRTSWGILPWRSCWLTTFLDSYGRSRQARHFRINCPRVGVWAQPPSPYPLREQNLQTFPGPGMEAQRSVAGGLGGSARLEGLHGSPCKLSNHTCTSPTIRGIWVLVLSAFLFLSAFHYVNQSCLLAGSTLLRARIQLFSALQLPFVRLITSIQSTGTAISLLVSVSLWSMPSVIILYSL